ncbi:hypothetical protein C1T31_08830 [Hanstruepera neustonica]|uniref:Uncharacterized protein n=1 Tax=Hanstruepera neustonica TaxID=1445657 RepID=A0A2K1DYI5_9FLAO|nr:hypothetical protein [Hanstruepera neustonica]PNQ73084.1 hypothetical protein C1T31_08830 [Hanstruepera neustonica]
MTDNAILPETENLSEDIKLYSIRAIGGATFLGGPLAGGFMISENFRAINKPVQGRNALLMAILVAIAVFSMVFFVPETILDKIPNVIIPSLYTVIGLGIVEWQMGDLLKNHKAANKPFYSGWRAAGIGLISLIITFAILLAGIFLLGNDAVYEEYDTQMEPYFENENNTLGFYDRLETASVNELLYELDSNAIPKWIENVAIIKKVNTLEDLPPELVKQNTVLLEYAELRVETFKLFRKAIEENTTYYDNELEQLHLKIENTINTLE